MAKNPPGYFCLELERWSCCDGHWVCICPEEETIPIIESKQPSYYPFKSEQHKRAYYGFKE